MDPASGHLRAQWAGSFLDFLVTDPPRGGPSGSAAFIVTYGQRVTITASCILTSQHLRQTSSTTAITSLRVLAPVAGSV
jgi:hypothetical protein